MRFFRLRVSNPIQNFQYLKITSNAHELQGKNENLDFSFIEAKRVTRMKGINYYAGYKQVNIRYTEDRKKTGGVKKASALV
jgi:hypothetical protein